MKRYHTVREAITTLTHYTRNVMRERERECVCVCVCVCVRERERERVILTRFTRTELCFITSSHISLSLMFAFHQSIHSLKGQTRVLIFNFLTSLVLYIAFLQTRIRQLSSSNQQSILVNMQRHSQIVKIGPPYLFFF